MAEPKRIVMISTGQPASNPRLVKEANALSAAGYRVHVLYSYWADWAQELDREILAKANWTATQCGGTPYSNIWRYRWTRLRRKIASFSPGYLPAVQRSFCRAYDELLQAAVQQKADLYISHNLGALPVAAQAAARNNSKYAFDAEDYHSGETRHDEKRLMQTRLLEDQFLPGALYRTAASPLIGATYKETYPELDFCIIDNVFPSDSQPPFRKTDLDRPLKLFWFSQTIGPDRGLQDILSAAQLLPYIPLSISLVGDINPALRAEFTKQIIHPNQHLEFLKPLPEHALFELAAKCDIGLGLERNQPHNRDICLTNKIFVYLLSGNALLLTSTRAQKEFLNRYPQIGADYTEGDIKALAKLILKYHSNRSYLEGQRFAAWMLGKTELNWDVEQTKLLDLIKRRL